MESTKFSAALHSRVRESMTRTSCEVQVEIGPNLSESVVQLSSSLMARCQTVAAFGINFPPWFFIGSVRVSKWTREADSFLYWDLGSSRTFFNTSRPLSRSKIRRLYPASAREAREPVLPAPESPSS